jgi:hypothetical protein
MCPSAPYLFFFTCLTQDNFTRQWGSSAAQWVKVANVTECSYKLKRTFCASVGSDNNTRKLQIEKDSTT